MALGLSFDGRKTMTQKFRIFGFTFNSLLIRLILISFSIITLIITVWSRNVFAQIGATDDLISGTALLSQSKLNMFFHGHMGPQGEILKYERQFALIWWDFV